jgi:drug/metabolite transporter (DMT)-like permease
VVHFDMNPANILHADGRVSGVVGFAVYLFAEGYSGGSDQQSVAPLAFPLSFLILAVVGIPLTLACALSWAGYLAATRKHRRLSR